MKSFIIFIASMMMLSDPALAVQKDFTVTAMVDASIDMTLSDGSSLPKSAEMQYIPGNGLDAGLSPVTMMTKIWSSQTSAEAGNVRLTLVDAPELINMYANDNPVNLTVSWGGRDLMAGANYTIPASDLFPNGAEGVKTGSVNKELKIRQTRHEVLNPGFYRGIVTLYISQDPATNL